MPFIATLWAAILMALLCALAPDGPPSSKATGSAFNPATTSVLLKVRSHSMIQAARPSRPDGDDVTPVWWLLAAALALLLLWRAMPRLHGVEAAPTIIAGKPTATRRARAPPRHF